MRRGEVYWHRFAPRDKRRPVLVLTQTALLGHLATVTVTALSRTIREVAPTLPPDIMSRVDRALIFALGVGDLGGA